MNDEHAIIDADFATFRLIQGRKVCQLVMEVAIERTQEVLDKLGMPVTGEGCPVAIARLQVPKE